MRLRTISLAILAAFTVIAFTGCGNWVDRLLGILDGDNVPPTVVVDCEELAVDPWQENWYCYLRGPMWVADTTLQKLNPFIHMYEVVERTGERVEWRFAQTNGRWYGQTSGYTTGWFKVGNMMTMRTVNRDSTTLEKTKLLIRRANGHSIVVRDYGTTAYTVTFLFYCDRTQFQMRSNMPYLYLLNLLYSEPETCTPYIEELVPIAWG
jgi:hypothetical protein